MKKDILQKGNAVTPLLLRLALGIVLFPHGAQKLLGWFGGYGFEGTMQFFTKTIHLPPVVGFAEIMIEFFGPIALVLGVGTRIVSLLTSVVVAGIVITSHIQFGFFMNWFGTQKGEGCEYFILMTGCLLPLIVTGAGKWSLDARLKKIA